MEEENEEKSAEVTGKEETEITQKGSRHDDESETMKKEKEAEKMHQTVGGEEQKDEEKQKLELELELARQQEKNAALLQSLRNLIGFLPAGTEFEIDDGEHWSLREFGDNDDDNDLVKVKDMSTNEVLNLKLRAFVESLRSLNGLRVPNQYRTYSLWYYSRVLL